MKRQNYFVLSIGLNVGDAEPVNQEAKTLRMIAEAPEYDLEVVAVVYQTGEWEGVPERSVQVLVRHRSPTAGPEMLRRDVCYYAEALAANLDQDAVAVISRLSDRPATRWILVNSSGSKNIGAGVSEFPVLPAIAAAVRG